MLTKEKIVDVMGAFPLHADEWVDEYFVRFARAIESLVRERTIDLCIEDVKDSFEQDCCRAEVIAALAALKEKK